MSLAYLVLKLALFCSLLQTQPLKYLEHPLEAYLLGRPTSVISFPKMWRRPLVQALQQRNRVGSFARPSEQTSCGRLPKLCFGGIRGNRTYVMLRTARFAMPTLKHIVKIGSWLMLAMPATLARFELEQYVVRLVPRCCTALTGGFAILHVRQQREVFQVYQTAPRQGLH